MEKLQLYLDSQKITRAEFAKRCEITPGRITQIMQGDGEPSLGLIRRMIVVSKGKLTANDFIGPKLWSATYIPSATSLH